MNLKCTYAQQKPWAKCSPIPPKVQNSNATPKHTPQWKVKTWWRPSNANLQNERKKPQCKKKPQTNHKLNLGNQRIEDQTWNVT